MTINPKVKKWFEEGYFKEALLGEEKFRIPDHTFTERHDRILVINQLLLWLNSKSNKDEILKIINSSIRNLLWNNFADAIHIVYCYFLLRKDFKYSLNYDVIAFDTTQAIKKNAAKIVAEEELRNIVISLGKFIPEILEKME